MKRTIILSLVFVLSGLLLWGAYTMSSGQDFHFVYEGQEVEGFSRMVLALILVLFAGLASLIGILIASIAISGSAVMFFGVIAAVTFVVLCFVAPFFAPYVIIVYLLIKLRSTKKAINSQNGNQ